VVVFSPLFIVQVFGFFFLPGVVSVCLVEYSGLPQGWLGKFCVMLGTHLFSLPNVFWAGFKLGAAVAMVVVAAAHLFSQCNVVWRSFLQTIGSACQSFHSPWSFISTNCESSISAVLESRS
jgi:hypothetical protein